MAKVEYQGSFRCVQGGKCQISQLACGTIYPSSWDDYLLDRCISAHSCSLEGKESFCGLGPELPL